MEAIHVSELKFYGINFRNRFLNSCFSELLQKLFWLQRYIQGLGLTPFSFPSKRVPGCIQNLCAVRGPKALGLRPKA